MKKTLVVLTLVLASGAALADGNGGPQAPNSAFLIWQQQGAKGQSLSSLEALKDQGRPVEMAQQPSNVVQR